MKKETYIAAMQKINLLETFREETIELLLSGGGEQNNEVQKNIQKEFMSHRKFIKVAMVALVIIITMSGITVAAAKFNIVDIFKGYFKQPAKQEIGNNNLGDSSNNSAQTLVTEPIKEENEFIKQAGFVIYSTTNGNGLVLTARGIVGDKNNTYIAVDVETEDGGPFTKNQTEDVTELSFHEVWLEVDDNKLGQYCYATRIDDGTDSGKATFVIKNAFDLGNMEGSGDNINRHFSITFKNLRVSNMEGINDIGTNVSVYDILNELGEASDQDYYYMGVRATNADDREWYHDKEDQVISELKDSGITFEDATSFNKVYEIMEAAAMQRGGFTPKYCIKRTEHQVRFCTDFPKLAVSNIGVRNNQLVVKFELNKELNFESFKDAGIVLVNKKNGNIIEGISATSGVGVNGETDEDQNDMVDDIIISCSTQFNGITSVEELKDYYFAFGGAGFSYQTVAEGAWTLDFDVAYSDTTREYSVTKEVKIDGVQRQLKQISISPITLQLWLEDISENDSKEFKKNNIKILLSDSSEIELTNISISDNCISSVLPVIIDLKQVVAIDINGDRIVISY